MNVRIRLIAHGGASHSLEALCPNAEVYILEAALRSEGMPCDVVSYRGLDARRPVAEQSSASRMRGMVGWASRLTGHWGGFPVLYQPSAAHDFQQPIELTQARVRQLLSSPASVIAYYVENRHDCHDAIMLAAHVRDHGPDIHQTLIGPHAVRFGQSILGEHPSFDSALTGDPLSGLLSLADRLNTPDTWEGIPDFVFRNPEGVILFTGTGRQPFASNNRCGLMQQPGNGHDTSRHDCFNLFSLSFSASPGACAPKPMDRLLNEISYLRKKYNAIVFHLDAAGIPLDSIENFAETLLEDNIMLVYSLGNLSVAFNESTAERLFASGCRAVGFAIPSGSQRLLEDFYDCDMSISAMRATLRLCRSAGLFTVARMCYPCPRDDYHTRAETELFLEACRPDAVRFDMPVLTPGSQWYTRAYEYGFSVDHCKYLRWTMSASDAHPGLPYQMRGWTTGRIAHERDSLNEVARALECVTGIAEREGLLARLSRSVMEEGLFLEQLKRALSERDTTRLAQLMAYANTSAGLFHPEEQAPRAASERLLASYSV